LPWQSPSSLPDEQKTRVRISPGCSVFREAYILFCQKYPFTCSTSGWNPRNMFQNGDKPQSQLVSPSEKSPRWEVGIGWQNSSQTVSAFSFSNTFLASYGCVLIADPICLLVLTIHCLRITKHLSQAELSTKPYLYLCMYLFLILLLFLFCFFKNTYGWPGWGANQGCQMVCFQTKNPNLGKFWRALDWKMLICFMVIWNILWPFGIFYDHLVQFVFIWYIFPVFGIMHKEKSGNPASGQSTSSKKNKLKKVLANTCFRFVGPTFDSVILSWIFF
jgi:hypothetical protein